MTYVSASPAAITIFLNKASNPVSFLSPRKPHPNALKVYL